MNLLPKASGHRPRLACEIFAGGVVAARSPEPGAPLDAVSRADVAEGAILPSLKPGNIADRMAVIAAVRRTLEQVGARSNARKTDLTLIIPDAATRVLLLDFDSLPGKLSEALPIVRFRLKKLVPFEADDAMVSFQVMSTSRTVVRVLAVTIPRDVLSEYESVAREAGFEPGAVLPSTLAALAGVDEADGASLLVNAHTSGVTTAIVRAGIVLLHRTVELAEGAAPAPANLPAALFERSPAAEIGDRLSLVSREDSVGEWAAQEPLPEYGLNAYADRLSTEAAVEAGDGITALPGGDDASGSYRRATEPSPALPPGSGLPHEATPRFPYASPTISADLNAELHYAILGAQTSPGSLTDLSAAHEVQAHEVHRTPERAGDEAPEPAVHTLAADVQAEEIARAVSVAVAYFEDSLGAMPGVLLSAGPLGAERLNRTLREQGVAETDGLRVRELIESAVLGTASGTGVPRGWLSGVVGALKS